MNRKIEKVLKNEHENYIFPFLWMHGESEEILREYMGVIYDSNIRSVCVESRPHPDFCREKWWKDMDVILDEARKRKMQVWILDDSHFPTGFANGALANQPDELCRQSVCCRTYEPEGNLFNMKGQEILHPEPFVKSMIENYTMEKEPRVFDDDRLLALYAVRCNDAKEMKFQKEDIVDLRPFIKEHQLEWEIPEGKWKIYALHLSRNQGYHRSYINMMNRKSCRVQIEAVYEPHYKHYKEDFGTTIAGFFSDEPELGNGHMYDMDDAFGKPNDYPWSEELEKLLKDKLGENYAVLLAMLWENKADSELTAKVRYAYMDAVTRLVEKDFSWQIGNWCREHGVKYIGHLIEDDNHHTRTGSSLGHYFRGLAGQDMAGIDDIGGQVFPQGEEISYNNGIFAHRNGEFYHYVLGKLGSSAASIEPLKKGNSMCEIFGNYGWEEGVRLEKYLADHFLVRGINHFVPHAFSPKEFPNPDCPPHFYAHGHNPQYRHFGYLMAYMNRVCELLSGGIHKAPVAILYHAEGDWTGEHMTMDAIAHILADHQIEYDIIPQDVFAKSEEYQTEFKDGELWVNTQKYRVVMIPYMKYITHGLAKAVEKLSGCGVSVIFVGGYPEGYCDEQQVEGKNSEQSKDNVKLEVLGASAEMVNVENLAEELQKKGMADISLTPADSRIRYRHYTHSDGTKIIMFVNEGTEMYKGTVSLKEQDAIESGYVYEYDAWDNKLYAVTESTNLAKTKEMKNITMEIEPLKSKIFVLSKENVSQVSFKKNIESMKKEECSFSKKWTRSICKSIDYPKFEKEKEISFPDKLAEEEPEFSGFVRYDNQIVIPEFDSSKSVERPSYLLEVTDASEGVEVFINDVSQGIQIVPVFYYDLTESLKPGKNTIRIEVATTLERQMAGIPDQSGRTKDAKAQSGITGEVKLWKN